MKKIVSLFETGSEIEAVEPLGNGLINDTFKVITKAGEPDYVLQRINNAIFTDVEMLQNNIGAVTEHIRRKLVEAGEDDIDRKVLRFVPAREGGKTWVLCDGKYWRLSVFIEKTVTKETVTPESSRLAGVMFGRFESMLTDIPVKLGETIPDFHNMELRLRQLKDAVKADAAGRMALPEVREILSDIEAHADSMCFAEKLYREGRLPKRICHCDTKVNNMLFDESGAVLCVIDLDTVMPSFIYSDYGDFLRTSANFVWEDDPDISKVGLNMDIFRSFTEGYLEGSSSFLTDIEKEYLPQAVCLFPFMQAVRFFADFINGDTYYRIKYPDHNLVRTRNQMALFHDALGKLDEMKSFIGGNYS